MQRKTFTLLDGSKSYIELSDKRREGYFLTLSNQASSDTIIAVFPSQSDADLAFAALSRADTIA